MLFRTFSEIDLEQLNSLIKAIKTRQKLPYIDLEAVLSTYEGHTIFSLFWDQIEVIEQILSQIDQMDFPMEDNFDG